MNIRNRLINAYRTDGIKEIARKAFFHEIYKINNKKTKRKVHEESIHYGLYNGEREVPIVVSLTSFPDRLESIHICLKSLLLQELKPDRIIVYLGNDSSDEQITPEMQALKKYGIEYRIDSEKNLIAHKKYFYAMQEFPDSIIVTADDDLYYPSNWLKSLYESYLKYPNAISARRVHKMRYDSCGELLPYNNWIDQCRSENEPSFYLFGTGGSGKLYPPHILVKETFNDNVFMDICKFADDVWLKCMEVLSDVPTVWVPSFEVDLESVKQASRYKLSNDNVHNCLNDELLKNVMNKYCIKVEDFFK